jgi:undecaprenyl-diphosphatase
MELPLFRATDIGILEILTRHRTPTLDTLSHFLLASDLRIGVLAVLLLYTWLAPAGAWLGKEQRVARDCAGIVLAMFVCFVVRHVLPSEPRPRLVLALDFPPLGELPHLLDFRAFPSDTACLAGAITMTVFLASRRLGWCAAAWTLFGVCLPRVYFGYHYASDLLAGFVVGATVAWTANHPRLLPLGPVPRVLRDWHEKHQALGALVLVLVAHQIGTMFPLLQLIGAHLRGLLR